MAAPRKFDHDEARRLRAEGMTYTELARRMGVNFTAVKRVCDEEVRKRMDAEAARWTRDNSRIPCRGGCGRLVWMHQPGRSGYCPTCFGQKITEANGPMHGTPTGYGSIRRCRCEDCRRAATEAKRRFRESRKVPCVRCGELRLHPNDASSRAGGTGLCVSCWRADRTNGRKVPRLLGVAVVGCPRPTSATSTSLDVPLKAGETGAGS